jgi:hypothetical protein
MNLLDSPTSRTSFLKKLGSFVAVGMGVAALPKAALGSSSSASLRSARTPLQGGVRYVLQPAGNFTEHARGVRATPDSITANCCSTGGNFGICGGGTPYAANCTDRCGTFVACVSWASGCRDVIEPGC